MRFLVFTKKLDAKISHISWFFDQQFRQIILLEAFSEELYIECFHYIEIRKYDVLLNSALPLTGAKTGSNKQKI